MSRFDQSLLGLGRLRARSFRGDAGSAPAIITGTAPVLASLTDGDTVTSAYTAGTYSSTAGTISSAVETVTINGATGALGDVVSVDDIVSISVLVTDSAGNTRTFSTVTQTVAGIAPTATGAPTITGSVAEGETVTINEGTYTGTTPITITGTLTLNGADVSADMVGSTYTIPASTTGQALVWSEVASNGTAPDATQSVTQTVANVTTAFISGGIFDENSLTFASDQPGTATMTLVPSAEPTPSAEQVQAGNDSSGAAAVFTTSFVVVEGTNSVSVDTTGVPDGEYKHCLVVAVAGAPLSNVLSPVATIDNTAPTVSSYTLAEDGTTLTILTNETLVSSGMTTSDFTVEVDGDPVALSGVTLSGSSIVLTAVESIVSGATVLVSYTGDTIGDIATPPNLLGSFLDSVVQNNSTQSSSTSFSTAITDVSTTSDDYRFSLTSTLRDGHFWFDGLGQEQAIDTSFSSSMSTPTKNLLLAAGSFVLTTDVRLGTQTGSTSLNITKGQSGGDALPGGAAAFEVSTGGWVLTPTGYDAVGFADVSSNYSLPTGTVYRVWLAWTTLTTHTRVYFTTNDGLDNTDFRNFAIFDRTIFDPDNAVMATQLAGISP